jgi:hypothetical protein
MSAGKNRLPRSRNAALAASRGITWTFQSRRGLLQRLRGLECSVSEWPRLARNPRRLDCGYDMNQLIAVSGDDSVIVDAS